MVTYTHAGNYNNYLDGCMNEQGQGAGVGKVLAALRALSLPHIPGVHLVQPAFLFVGVAQVQ